MATHVQERGFPWPLVSLAPLLLSYPAAHSVSPSPALHALDDAPDAMEGEGRGGRGEGRGAEGRGGEERGGEERGGKERGGRRGETLLT